MRHLHIISILFSFAFLLPYHSKGQAKYSNEFLSIGVGARALGMSNANIASVNDVTAGYWNPSGLVGFGGNIQVGLMHSQYFGGIANYDYGALAISLDSSSALGFSLIRFGVDNIPNTTELIDANGNIDYDRISTFSAADYGFLVSYAKIPKIKGLRLGGNGKIIRRKVGDFAGAWGFGIDASAQYDYHNWKFGAMARDITTTFNAWSYNLSYDMKEAFLLTGNEIPQNSIELTLPKLILGSARKFDLWKSHLTLLAEIDADITFDGQRNVLVNSDPVSIDPNVGFELGYINMIFLRGGIGNIQKTTDIIGASVTTFQPNMGVGLKFKNLSIDYALTDIGDRSVALLSHVFSLRLEINKKAH